MKTVENNKKINQKIVSSNVTEQDCPQTQVLPVGGPYEKLSSRNDEPRDSEFAAYEQLQ